MTAIDANSPTPATEAPKKGRFAWLKPTPDESKVFGLIAAIAGVWIAATVLFGFAGLIIGALTMVAVVMVGLVLISRG